MLWKLYGIKGDTLMKKTDNKNNSKFKSVIALILATCVVIGLLSSTAIKLVTATYLMQSSKKVQTGIAPLDDAINEYIEENAPTAPAPTQGSVTTTAPAATSASDSTSAPDTTGAQDTTSAPDTTEAQDTTSAPDTTKAPETTKAETQETTLSEKQILKNNQSVLKSYNQVLVKNKLNGHKPGFKKVTTRDLSKDLFGSIFMANVEKNDTVKNYLAGSVVNVNAGASTDELCLNNVKYASTLDETNEKLVKSAIKSSTREDVYMGYIKNKTSGEVVHGYNKDMETGKITKLFDYKDADYTKVKEVAAVRVEIQFNDETNPVPADKNGKSKSFIASVFPVVTAEQVSSAMNKSGVTEVNVTYKDCSVEMYYDSKDGDIYSLTQNIKYDVAVKDGIVKATGTVTQTDKYGDFVY